MPETYSLIIRIDPCIKTHHFPRSVKDIIRSVTFIHLRQLSSTLFIYLCITFATMFTATVARLATLVEKSHMNMFLDPGYHL